MIENVAVGAPGVAGDAPPLAQRAALLLLLCRAPCRLRLALPPAPCAAATHCLPAPPSPAEAAVIGIPDARWGERPLLIVAPRQGAPPPTPADVLGYLEGRIARWWCAPPLPLCWAAAGLR